MKVYSYCGRENQDDAQNCGGCGSEPAKTAAEPNPKRRDFAGLNTPLKILAFGAVALLLYGLSFGPALRYCATATTVATAPMTTNATATSTVFISATTIRTARYPWWFVIYSPLFGLHNTSAAYSRYLDWWENRP